MNSLEFTRCTVGIPVCKYLSSLALFFGMNRQFTTLKSRNLSHQDFSKLEDLRNWLMTTLRPYHCQVYLFGSWAAGNAQLSSDVDIAIWLEAPLPIGLLSQIRFHLEESSILLTVDLVDLGQTTPTFRERVLAGGKLWIDSTND